MQVSLSFSSSLLLLTFTFQLFILAQSPPLLLFVFYFCIMICRSISSYQKGVKCLAGRSPNVSLLEPPLSPPACCLACHLTWNTTRASGIKESVSSLANNPFFQLLLIRCMFFVNKMHFHFKRCLRCEQSKSTHGSWQKNHHQQQSKWTEGPREVFSVS